MTSDNAAPVSSTNADSATSGPSLEMQKADLRRRIASHQEERKLLMKQAIEIGGGDADRFISKAIPQSLLFMVEIIPLIHRLYMHLPVGARKTVLDIGPQTFSGTALLQAIHDAGAFTNLKMDITALDITDSFSLLKDIVAPNVEFLVSDLYGVEGRLWDLTIASHVIEHVPNPVRFIKRAQQLTSDYVVVACPWNESPIVTQSHINTIDKDFTRAIGARDLKIFTNYSWGKSREVCTFWLPGSPSAERNLSISE